MKGAPSGGGMQTYKMQFYDEVSGIAYDDYGNGVKIGSIGNHNTRVILFVANGTSAADLVWKPMIVHEEDSNNEYADYIMSNKDATDYLIKNNIYIEGSSSSISSISGALADVISKVSPYFTFINQIARGIYRVSGYDLFSFRVDKVGDSTYRVFAFTANRIYTGYYTNNAFTVLVEYQGTSLL